MNICCKKWNESECIKIMKTDGVHVVLIETHQIGSDNIKFCPQCSSSLKPSQCDDIFPVHIKGKKLTKEEFRELAERMKKAKPTKKRVERLDVFAGSDRIMVTQNKVNELVDRINDIDTRDLDRWWGV